METQDSNLPLACTLLTDNEKRIIIANMRCVAENPYDVAKPEQHHMWYQVAQAFDTAVRISHGAGTKAPPVYVNGYRSGYNGHERTTRIDKVAHADGRAFKNLLDARGIAIGYFMQKQHACRGNHD